MVKVECGFWEMTCKSEFRIIAKFNKELWNRTNLAVLEQDIASRRHLLVRREGGRLA